MHLFTKKGKDNTNSQSQESSGESYDEDVFFEQKPKIKKKIVIGSKNKKKEKKQNKEEDKKIPLQQQQPSEEDNPVNVKRLPQPPAILQKNMKGKPVYLEDTGEKLGTVQDIRIDKQQNSTIYKIKDNKSDSILSFPKEQFQIEKDGLIFIPNWYLKALRDIEQFEFNDRVSPELLLILMDDAISFEELYEIFLRHDNEMAENIDHGKALLQILETRLRLLEKQRLETKDDLLNLTEKRLIKDIDRKQFSDDVAAHRRKVNILDINIKKTKELLDRLENTSIGKMLLRSPDISDDFKIKKEEESQEDKPKNIQQIQQDFQYKQRYENLKEQYTQLEQDYNELKQAVEKLFYKEELSNQP